MRITKSQMQTHTHITHFQGKMETRVKTLKEDFRQSQRQVHQSTKTATHGLCSLAKNCHLIFKKMALTFPFCSDQ